MKVTRRTRVGIALFGAAVLAIEGIIHRPQPAFCDFTKMAYQTPEFFNHYWGYRQHSSGQGYDIINGIRQPVEGTDYSPETDSSPPLSVTFYKGRAIRFMVTFPQPLTPSETARRVGLRLSALQPMPHKRSRYMPSAKYYTGVYKGVKYKELFIDKLNYGEPKDRASLVIAYLAR